MSVHFVYGMLTGAGLAFWGFVIALWIAEWRDRRKR